MLDALEYIPHSGKMALIETIIRTGENWVECLVKPQNSELFKNSNGKVPSWMGIEYMAQAIAAYSGWRAKLEGRDIQPGFLLGSRDYKCARKFLEKDLIAKAEMIFQNDDLASFECTIIQDDEILAQAKINVYQPEDFQEAIKDRIS